jgi:hypothetical protein
MKPWRLWRQGVVLALMLSGPAGADDFKVGDWAWNIDDPEMQMAGTTNEDGHVLTQLCYPESGKCIYAVGFDTNCTEGNSYPALVNADSGAAAIQFRRGGKLEDGTSLMLVEDFDQIDALIRKSSRIGFALPMEGDAFKAVRFSLRGSSDALDAMRKVAERASKGARGADSKKASEVF